MSQYIIVDESMISNGMIPNEIYNDNLMPQFMPNYMPRYINSKYNNSDNSNNAIIVILIILIILIIIYLWYICRGNANNTKNQFVASAKAQKEFGIINEIYSKDSNPKYSEIKSHIADIDPVKHTQINTAVKNNTLTPEMIDRFDRFAEY